VLIRVKKIRASSVTENNPIETGATRQAWFADFSFGNYPGAVTQNVFPFQRCQKVLKLNSVLDSGKTVA
jgi:hypothetical protein